MGEEIMRKRILSSLFILLLVMSLLTGCLNTKPSDESSEPKVLKILTNEWVFRETAPLFEVSHDNVTVELINVDQIVNEMYRNQGPDQKPKEMKEVYKEILTGPNAPDVVYIDANMFKDLVNEGLLQSLDTFIQKEKYDIEGMAPAVVEGIREMGNGTLYALAPTFTSQALFYNKTFFDKRGVQYPTDGMTWEDILNLARELSYEENGEKKYGFGTMYGDLYNLVNIYANQLGLSQYDEEYKTFTVNTPEWEKAWSTFINLQKEGVIAPPFDYAQMDKQGNFRPYMDHDFLSGRAAMQIMNYNDVRQVAEVMNGNYMSDSQEKLETFEWDVVTFPVHPEMPDVGGPVYMNVIMGINANAQNADLAWEYIAFMNGDKVAKARANTSWELASRVEYNKAPLGLEINMNAFTSLKPAPLKDDMTALYQKFPNGNAWEIFEAGRQEFEAARKGEKTVQQALADYQKKGQEILDRLNQGQNGSGGAETQPATEG
jgi:multiple sugar transport system substrate-binding protein